MTSIKVGILSQSTYGVFMGTSGTFVGVSALEVGASPGLKVGGLVTGAAKLALETVIAGRGVVCGSAEDVTRVDSINPGAVCSGGLLMDAWMPLVGLEDVGVSGPGLTVGGTVGPSSNAVTVLRMTSDTYDVMVEPGNWVVSVTQSVGAVRLPLLLSEVEVIGVIVTGELVRFEVIVGGSAVVL